MARSGVLVADTAKVMITRVKLHSNSVDGVHVTGGYFACTLCTIAQNANLGADAQDEVGLADVTGEKGQTWTLDQLNKLSAAQERRITRNTRQYETR